MPRTTIFDRFFRTPERRQKFIYLQTVPVRRLVPLLCAIFCLFGMIGFIIDLFQLGQKPILNVLLWTLFTGLMAVGYLLVLTRTPRWIAVPIAAHFAGSWVVASCLHYLDTWQVQPTIESGVKIAAASLLFLSMLACFFFFVFIHGEGQRAVRIQTELALAHGIQETLVPEIDEELPGMEIYGATVPSDQVGGDLVDVVRLRDGSVIAYVADIAGHGLPAGILMGMLKTAVRTQLPDVPSLTALFQRLNEVLPALKEPHAYATCTALRILNSGPDQSWAVEYALAGQPPLLHVCAASGRITSLSEEQFPIGLVPNVTYSSRCLPVQAGDLLVIATDGVLDAEDARGEAFGLDRLGLLLLEDVASPLGQIAERIRKVSSAYRQVDDQTLLLVRFAPRLPKESGS
jgi:stage II sporulation SpoE-like protein